MVKSENVPNRFKLRREYIKRILSLYFFKCLTNVLGYVLAFGSFVALSLLVPKKTSFSGGACVFLLFGVLVLYALYIFKYINIIMERLRRYLAEVKYVPPVTLHTLPQEETLVRGITSGSSPNKMLLRPSTEIEQSRPDIGKKQD